MVGAWSDRFKSKWGRRHPFVYIAIIPFGLSAYFLYSIPTDTSQTALFIKLLIASILLRTLFTFYETPRAAIGPELITDYERRNTLSGYGVLYGNMGLGIKKGKKRMKEGRKVGGMTKKEERKGRRGGRK